MAFSDALHPFIATLREEIIALRHDLHQHPELSFQEFRTQQLIMDYLQSLGLKPRKIAKTGVTVTLVGDRKGPTVALRADIDALPMPDESDVPYASINPGVCHACGHDAHTAILLGVAKTFCQHRDFAGEIILIFQPSEEQLPGGAPSVLESGALEQAEAIFGLHVWQSLPFGVFATHEGALMASPDDFTITIHGKGGHASMPYDTIDPIIVAAAIIQSLQTLISRTIRTEDAAVLSVTKIHAGTAMNVIPEVATLAGTLRTLDPVLRERLPKQMQTMVEHIASSYGARAEFTLTKGYPALINDPLMATIATNAATALFGEQRTWQTQPSMGGEDFAFYLEKMPGAFFFLGMGTEYAHHHPKFNADDAILEQGIQLMCEVALQFLAK